MASTFFADMAQTLGADLGQNLLNKTGSFISQISPLFQAAFSIYVLMVIISYYGQSGGVSFVDSIKRSVGWLVIIGLAFSPSLYMKLANIIYGLPDEFASTFVGANSFSPSAMDTSLGEVGKLLDKVSEVHKQYAVYEISAHMITIKVGLIISICAGVIIGVAFAYYMVAKISLALVLMLGACFVGCLLFPSTRQYGMNWIGQCLNYIITCTFFVLLTMVQMVAFDKAVLMANTGSIADVVAIELLPPVFLLQTIIFLVIAWNIPNIASSLTGGAAVQGMARQLAASAGAASALTRSVGRMAGAVPNRRSSGGSISGGSNKRPS